MNTTVFTLILIGIFLLLIIALKRAPAERWWWCDSCGYWHNEGGDRTEIEPIESRGTSVCEHCRKDTAQRTAANFQH